MAYVPVSNDLNRIKTKLAFNLTKRQLICFSIAGGTGIPIYLFTRSHIGNSISLFLTPRVRPYRTENLYAFLNNFSESQ
ncbi:MAG: PrgI family protein [Lachnospiraceae bacterium]|nr:PrgI family protein [Lachnospiraceae bacterium]